MASYKATNLKFRGFSGHIMLLKVRWEYGDQSLKQQKGMLKSWYSDLNAYLPEALEKTKITQEKTDKINDGLSRASILIEKIDKIVIPNLEIQMVDSELEHLIFELLMTLDVVTAISKVIDDVQPIDEDGVSCG